MKKFRTPEAAKALGVSPSFLAQLRSRGGGPRFTKLAKKVVIYDASDLEAWAQARAQDSQ